MTFKFNYVFVLTYGRSGSTLLQGVLNSIEGVQIRGENNGALFGLIRSYKALQAAKHSFAGGSEEPESPWYGAAGIKVDNFGKGIARVFVNQVLRPEEGTKVTGFKEIRYYPPGLNDAAFEECIFFMRHYFPKAALIVNTRNMDDVLRSNRIAGHNVSEAAIRGSDTRLRQLVAKGSPDVFHVHYDDYKKSPVALKPLFEFLGTPFNLERVQAVLDVVHSTVSPRLSESGASSTAATAQRAEVR